MCDVRSLDLWFGRVLRELNADKKLGYVSMHPEILVGKKIEVKWRGGWQKGTVTRYDKKQNIHSICYEDKEVRRYNMNNVLYRFPRSKKVTI